MSLIIGGLFGLIFAVLAFLVRRKFLISVLFFAANLFYVWKTLPVLKYGFTDVPKLILFNGIALVILSVALNTEKRKTKLSKLKAVRSPIALGTLAIGLISFLVVPFLTSFAGFHSGKYHNLIGDLTVGKFSNDVAAIDMSQIRRVDGKLARNVAEKRLGEDRGLGSQVDVGYMSIQAVNGKLYWVGPLNHSKFRRWLDNREGTLGYVMVSASNENDVTLVQDVAGTPVKLKYNFGSRFGDYPPRYLYDNGYATYGLTDWTFEIDDKGRPHYVVTNYKKRVGFKGSDATGVVILDVQSGDIKEYSIADAPVWVDRIQPANMVNSQLDYWGKYGDGWLNSWLGAEGVLQSTEGISLVYGNDGKSYFYTGMQSVGADEGTIGFVLVNTRTKEARLYEQAGATETAARQSGEDEFQDFGYQATYPILYNIGGVPTYFMTLKASSGLVKGAAFVSVEDYSIVGSGKTAEVALRNYNQALRGKGNFVAADDVANLQSVTGIVSRMQQEAIDQNVTYYFLLENPANKTFAVAASLSPEVRMTGIGDEVTISYNGGGNAVLDALVFDNTALLLQSSDIQRAIDAREEAVTQGE